MILIIDNYDSFVHNLARYVREAGATTMVVRNDALSADDCLKPAPAGVILSPGPKTPRDAGICRDLLDRLSPTTPLLGVCLGHQCLAEACGGETVRANTPMHGGASLIHHEGAALFRNIPSPFRAGRYHSLIAQAPPEAPLMETAWTEDGAVMAYAHETRPWFGVQFHPESILTPTGRQIIANFLDLCELEGRS